MIQLAILELAIAEGSLSEDDDTLPVRLTLAVHLTCVELTLIDFFLPDKLSVLVDFLICCGFDLLLS